MMAARVAEVSSRASMANVNARELRAAQKRRLLMHEKNRQRRATAKSHAVDAVADAGVETIESTSSVRRVYIEHTDAYQVMFYANYFRFAADAAEEALVESGVGVDARMVAVRKCKYARAARLGDDVRVQTRWLRHDGAGRVTFEQTLVGAQGDTYLSAEVT